MSDDLKGGEYYKKLFDKLHNDPMFIFKYGMEQGELLERDRIIQAFIDADSASSEWAIGIIKGENK
jgi:hypothetical protein